MQKGLKYFFRQFIFPCIVSFGLEKLLCKISSNHFLNITYHGVVKKDSTFFSPRHIDAKQFEKQIIYLKKHFNIVWQSEIFVLHKQKNHSKKKTIAISFDDGYLNNLEVALPILEKHGVKASFYISSIIISDPKVDFLWSDIIAGLNHFYPEHKFDFKQYKFKNNLEICTAKSLPEFIKCSEPSLRNELLFFILTTFDLCSKIKSLDNEIWKLMTKDQLKTFSNSSIVEIGSHGHFHYNLAQIDENFAFEELSKSKQVLENYLGLTVDTIAYPDGNYNPKIKNEAHKLGYIHQLAVNYLAEDDKADDRILNRFGISSTTNYASNIFHLNNAFRKKGF